MGNHRASAQNIRYCGVNCELGPSKSIRYSGDFVIAGFHCSEVRFHIFYCNSAGLSNVVRCNGVSVIAGFVIGGVPLHCRCKQFRTILFSDKKKYPQMKPSYFFVLLFFFDVTQMK